MEHITDLEAVTVMTFHDRNCEFARSYKGLLNFEEGDIINLRRTSQNMPVSPGNYVIRRRHISNQMGLALDQESKPWESKLDSIYRYYNCEKLFE